MTNRLQPKPDDLETLDLLRRLIEAPPPLPEPLAPTALRSADVQRDLAFQGFRRRTWLDRALRYSEYLLLLAAAGVFLFWLIDGPVRDWLHQQRAVSAPARAATTSQSPTRQTLSAVQRAAPLPFTTPDMEGSAPKEDFIAPRQVLGAPPATPPAPHPTRLIVPAIELDTPVVEVHVVDGAWEVAEYAAGYLNGTAWPGEAGNAALAGHAGLRGAVFRDLGRLNPGDDVFIDAGGWRYQYRVRESQSVWPTQVEVLDSTPTPMLTMITCTNWDTQRLVVVADLIASKPLPGA
jgi:sortase A